MQIIGQGIFQIFYINYINFNDLQEKINIDSVSLDTIPKKAIHNGILLSPFGTFTDQVNGISFNLLWNVYEKINGVSLGLVNLVLKTNGVQIGLINKTKKLRGFQFGLWNKNEKRSLPFINWNFHH